MAVAPREDRDCRAARVDHRSLEAQGIDREATSHVGYAGAEIAARGGQSDRRDALHAIVERNGLRAELKATDAELAQLHELVANENGMPRPAPEAKRGTRAMLEGPSDDELARQPEREKAYLAHLQQRHERARTMLAEQQRMRDLNDRAKAFQLAKEQEAEEGRKKQAAQEADASDGLTYSGAQSKCGGRAIKGHFRRTLAETGDGLRRTLLETGRTIGETDARSSGPTQTA